MKQIIQSAKSGDLKVKDLPTPRVGRKEILVKTSASLISSGTERMVAEFAKKNILSKARHRPDLVKKVLSKVKTDGLKAATRAVLTRLDEPIPLGYSASGIIMEIGAGIEGKFTIGERVAIAGAGIANHSEFNVVPENLAVSIPESVSDEEAAFATIASIAMHSVRNLSVQLGDVVAVFGAGLVGQLAAQFLKLSGARVIILDYDQSRLDLGRKLGAEKAINLQEDNVCNNIFSLTGGIGCDSILIAASTPTNEPFNLAAEISRDRGKICLVGMSGTEFPYAEFMKKELSLIVSRSYGPGRYDDDYEKRGLKYPVGFVRWTETANLAEVMRLLSDKTTNQLDVNSLITHRFDIGSAVKAFDMVLSKTIPHLGILINYPENTSIRHNQREANKIIKHTGSCVIGLFGAGNFSKSILLPALSKVTDLSLHTIVAKNGKSSNHVKEKFGFLTASSNPLKILDDPNINAVIIATRHDSHAELTIKSLNAGKHVLVEKPLGLSEKELTDIQKAYEKNNNFLQVGFNRRFAPLTNKLDTELAKIDGPRFMLFRINAGHIPNDSWIHNDEEGGGRIIGEMCHFIDFARHCAKSKILSVQADAAKNTGGSADDVTAIIRFENGSLATISYTGLGDTTVPKEQYEIFAGGTVLAINNFRELVITSNGNTKKYSGYGQDKGFKNALEAFKSSVNSDAPGPSNPDEIFDSSWATLAIMKSLRLGSKIDLI